MLCSLEFFLRLELYGCSEGESPVLRIVGKAVPSGGVGADVLALGVGALLQRGKECEVVDRNIEPQVLYFFKQTAGECVAHLQVLDPHEAGVIQVEGGLKVGDPWVAIETKVE